MRYFITGFMGSGKTYWGKLWSEKYGLKFYDLDEEIEKREGKSVTAIFEEKGEEAFRQMEKETLCTYMKLDDFILSCGGGAPCFHNNMKRMNEHGITIYIKSTVQQLVDRLHVEKETRPLIAGMDDEVLAQFIEAKLAERQSCYHQAMYHLPAAYMSLDNFQKIIRRNG